MKADYRIVVLLVLGIAFMLGAIVHSVPKGIQAEDIQESFIAFDTVEVFGLPTIEEECSAEPSPLSRLPAL